ncbi:hypothetical protein BZA05DRAFT_17272 [Tricharina praecox]|uniref:uncharacterized protein n=1 Tax=Tricharina praecox TaxID=43433 RepID=UPI00221EF614|nr:uncharacterized protein BZA05DRAFT_17272 [Tricharina praecox]KAI5858920.1 hypothetical protein BZA05DRAFT_17272 [Tricharina praecox]
MGFLTEHFTLGGGGVIFLSPNFWRSFRIWCCLLALYFLVFFFLFPARWLFPFCGSHSPHDRARGVVHLIGSDVWIRAWTCHFRHR